MNHTTTLAALLTLALTLLAACASTTRTPPPALADTGWTLIALAGEPVHTDRPPTLTFDAEGGTSGFAGLNRFTTAATFGEEGALSFGPIASTKMAGPPDLTALEDRFLAALEATRSAEVSGDRLILRDGDADPLATFAR